MSNHKELNQSIEWEGEMIDATKKEEEINNFLKTQIKTKKQLLLNYETYKSTIKSEISLYDFIKMITPSMTIYED